MEGLFEDRLGLVDLELGLEVAGVVGEAATVGAAAGIGEPEVFINHFFSEASPNGRVLAVVYQIECLHGQDGIWSLPVAFAATVLLDLFGVCVDMPVLGKEAWEMLSGSSGAVGETLVVTVIGLVRASHCATSESAIAYTTQKRDAAESLWVD